MKNKTLQLIILMVIVTLLAMLPFILNGRASGNDDDYHDNTVYDKNVPENEQSVLIVGNRLTLTSLDGRVVVWGNAPRDIPAGIHSITFEYYEVETTGSLPDEPHYETTYRGRAEWTFDFVKGVLYELTAYRDAGDTISYDIEKRGVTSAAVPKEHETLMIFRGRKNTTAGFSVYVHVKGEQDEFGFFIRGGNVVRQIVPNGTYVLYGSKGKDGKGGKKVELAARSQEIVIDVIEPTLLTQPEIRVKK